ncbi:Ltp family lipoprotein [Corynebacterium sp. H113]|uniref:Ltp family lipoprotein n=1 Tax=Corynebacterium sp. H113 TaxID=3133419 RepID=UPI0040401A5D
MSELNSTGDFQAQQFPNGNQPQYGQQNPYAQQPGQFAGQPMQPQPPAKKKGGCFKWGGIAAGIIVLAAIGSAMGGGSDSTDSASSNTDSAGIVATAPALDGAEDTTEAATDSDESANKADQNVPTEYTSALKKADTYANMMHMSKAGLYDQLTSEYGEKFSPDAAQYAVDNVQADWNRNALEKARSYQDTMAMSPDAIYDQLISDYGEQFTTEEADYALANL